MVGGIETNGGRKLILVLDEFEQLHSYLTKDQERGNRLLAATRKPRSIFSGRGPMTGGREAISTCW